MQWEAKSTASADASGRCPHALGRVRPQLVNGRGATETTAGTRRTQSCLADPIPLLHDHIHSTIHPVHRNLRPALQATARHGYSFLKIQSRKHAPNMSPTYRTTTSPQT